IPLEPAPPAVPATAPAPASAPAPAPKNPAPAVSARKAVPGPAPRDSEVVRTGGAGLQDDPTDRRPLPLEPGCPIARVGDEIITYHDLVLATRERLPKNLIPQGQEFNSEHQIELINQINKMRIDTLESLIERSILFQEAKRHIKDPKL